MKKLIGIVLSVCLCFCMCVNCCAERNQPMRLEQDTGNVIFDADIYGGDISRAALYKVELKKSDANMDNAAIAIFDRFIFRDGLKLSVFEAKKDQSGQVTERVYYTDASKERAAFCFFHDGGIGASTYEAGFYYGIMDIMASMQYSGECYIPDRLTCGDLPIMPVAEVTAEFKTICEQLELNVQSEPYIMRAYTMNEETLTKADIHPYRWMVIQGNDLMAENRQIVSEYGPDCYFVAYRYEVDKIPVSYSYHYIESKDYFTLPSFVQALYNDRGWIRIFAQNQFTILESSEHEPLITSTEAAQIAASYMNRILGVEPFVCKEISLEYVPLAYTGCDIEKEACLTPCWVFYFDGFDVKPIIINAFSGEMIE